MKRPAFQFYPGDWLRDTALRTCSIGARGLWIDIICFMHEGNPYGHLKVNQKVILPTNLAVMCGATLGDIDGWLFELSSAGVFEKTEDGTIYSRRMIRDEAIREARAAGGKLGGNPMLKDAPKVNHEVNLETETKVNRNPTPSSSSSSSLKRSNTLSGKPDVSDELKSQSIEILEYLNANTQRNYRPVDSNLKLITARLKSGATDLQCREVIFNKCEQWGKDPKMSEYLRPATLFNSTKFEQYLGEINAMS